MDSALEVELVPFLLSRPVKVQGLCGLDGVVVLRAQIHFVASFEDLGR
jgi:hypothetical protein